MGATKEADLISAVLRYAVRCLADGDREALRAMNFGPREIEALRGMHLADLARMESLGAHCLEVGLNRQVYWTMVAHLQRERTAEALQHDLVKADAPFEMMQTFFGLSSREYSRLRRVLAAAPAVGRPPEADEASQHALWTAWTRRREDTDADLLTPEAYLDLHHETGIGLRAIWTLTRRWAAFGDLTDVGAGTTDGQAGTAVGSVAKGLS
ncbi:MAG: DUF2857 domain-containing protein [Pseudomonadota bacterium]|nr:DUF2857 domain-containing protein [Pseudomonadota bacterium]